MKYNIAKRVWNNLRSNRQFQKWLYLFMLISIFFGLFLLLYAQFQTATLQTLTQVSSDFVVQVDTATQALMENIKTSAMQMFYTSSIKNLRTTNTLSKSENTMGHRDLGNFVSSSDFLESVMVYNEKLDIVFTSEEKHSSDKSGAFHDRDAVRLLVNPEQYPYLSPVRRSDGDKNYYSFLFFERNGGQTSSLLLNVNAQWYESHLLGIPGLGSHIIVNGEGQPVAYHDAALSEQVLRVWPDIQRRILENHEGGFLLPSMFSGDTGWLYQYMEQSGWYYLRKLQFNDVAPGIVYIRNLLFISFAAVGGIFLLGLIHLLVKVYLPYHHIRDALHYSGRDTRNISAQVNQLLERQKESDFVQIIKTLREGQTPAGFEFPVLLLMSDDHGSGSFRQEITAICPGAVAAQEGTSEIAAIPCCNVHDFQELSLCLPEKINAPLYFGNLCYSAEQLRASFAALEELRRLRFLYAEHPVLHERLLYECNAASGFQAKEVSGLMNLLKAGQLDPALKQWYSIFNEIRRDRFTDFCFAIRYIGKQLGLLQSELGLERQDISEEILQTLQDVSQLHYYMETQFTRIAEFAAKLRCEQLTGLTRKIDEYIREHYTEEELSAQQIADWFEVSAAYLNRQFRKVVGMSLSDAIHKVRIEKACQLLKDTNESVELIAQRIGYINTKYFFVVFKKLEGNTPKQFRESHK